MKSKDMDAILGYKPVVKAALETFIRKQQRSAGDGLDWQQDLADRMQTYATGGKLLRSCLVCYSYALESEAAPTEAVLNTAMALELLHSALLIHDDLIDRDDWRRGNPAMHKQYAQLGGKRKVNEEDRFGFNMALCGGDIAIFWALRLLSAAPLDTATNTALTDLFSRVMTTVCAGQMEDIYQGMVPGRASKQAIHAIMRAKTATYSVALPLEAGAILAGQPAGVLKSLHEIGMAAGTIFQIRDDELGILGRVGTLRKPAGSDIREGKQTLPYYYLWQVATPEDKRYFKTVFGNEAATQADITAIQEAFVRLGVGTRLKQDIDRLQAQAERHIQQLAMSQAARDKLSRLVALCASG